MKGWAWEAEVIELALAGEDDVMIEQHGAGTYYLYYRFPSVRGYDTKLNPTARMRVEWSSGTVHSHPR